MNHAMIDLETLATSPDACIISIGVAIFNDSDVVDTKGWAIAPKHWHGKIDPQTIAWWIKQSSDAKAASFEGTISDFTAAFELKTFLAQHDVREVWAKSPQFDVVILESWWKRLKDVGDFPIHYRSPRDVRTIEAEAIRQGYTKDMWAEYNYVAHNPVDDAAVQARQVIAIQTLLGSTCAKSSIPIPAKHPGQLSLLTAT
jgi:exodeoxyribonuclease VIII